MIDKFGAKHMIIHNVQCTCSTQVHSVHDLTTLYMYIPGFHTEGVGGGPGIPPRSMVINEVLNNNLVPDCVRNNLREFKFKIFLGEHAPRPP